MRLSDRLAGVPWLADVVATAAGYRQVHQRFGREFQARTRWLHELASDPQRVREVRDERLRTIVEAAASTPGYREHWRAVPSGSCLWTQTAKLGRLPPIRKSDLRDRTRFLTGVGASTLRSTSGTTGEPFTFAVSPALAGPINYAHMYRFYGWHGFGRGMRRATLGGRYLGRNSAGITARNFADDQLLLSAHSLTSADVARRYVAAIARFEPAAIQGHPSLIVRLCRLATGAAMPSVPKVFVTGETLSPDERAEIEDAFDCQVVSLYGHGEMCVMAGECEVRGAGHHIDEVYGVVELVEGPQGVREIVATSLWNEVQPFVRYRTGDIAQSMTDAPCPCGRPGPRLLGLEGRRDDALIDATGGVVPGAVVRTHLRNALPAPPLFQVRAERSGTLQLRLPAAVSLHVERTLASALGDLTGRPVVIDNDRIEESEVQSVGKWRTVIDEVL